MAPTTLTWIVVTAYVAVVLVTVMLRRSGAAFRVFAVGGRTTHPVLVGLSVAAGSASSTTFVINPGLVYLYGWSAFVAIYVASSAAASALVALVVHYGMVFGRLGPHHDNPMVPASAAMLAGVATFLAVGAIDHRANRHSEEAR